MGLVQSDNSYETGKNVWKALQEQMEEGRGFLTAVSVSFLKFIKKYILSLLLSGILFSGVALIIYFLKPEVYTAEMTVTYEHHRKKIYADMLEKLNELIAADQYESLSRLLNMPEQEVKMLKAVSTLNILEEPLPENEGTGKFPFYIEVKVKDPAILSDLETSIVNYLNGTKFTQKRLKYRLKKSRKELAFLEKRMAMVDSLRKLIDMKEEGKDNNTLTHMELLEKELTLFDRIQKAKRNIAFNENIVVLDGFIPSGRQNDKGIMGWLVLGFSGGLILRLLFLAFKRR